MLITLIEIAFDLTYVIISKTASGIYHGSKYLLSKNETNKNKSHIIDLNQGHIDLLEEITRLKQSNEYLKSELESMKITFEEFKSIPT